MDIHNITKLTMNFDRFRPTSDIRNSIDMIKEHIFNIKELILKEPKESQDWIIKTIVNNYLRFKTLKERKSVFVFAKKLNIYVKIDYPVFYVKTYKDIIIANNKINNRINEMLRNQLSYTLNT